MDERGLRPGVPLRPADLSRLPFTTKTDLRDTYPFGLFASPMSEVVRLHASSGTTGKPIVVAYTREDLDVWTSVDGARLGGLRVARTATSCRTPTATACSPAGWARITARKRWAPRSFPISGGNTDRQIMVMQDFRVTAICCTPSYFLHLVERAGELGVDMRDLPLRAGIFGAEPWTDSMRRHIESEGGIQAYDIYGLSEIIGPGVAIECACQDGLHIFEDHFYPEIVDPETRRGAARWRGGRAGADHAEQAGHAHDPLPHARHHAR